MSQWDWGWPIIVPDVGQESLGVELYSCPRCGAVVVEVQRHEEWHRDLAVPHHTHGPAA